MLIKLKWSYYNSYPFIATIIILKITIFLKIKICLGGCDT